MRIPSKNTSGYAICKHIHLNGPKNNAELVADLQERFSKSTIYDRVLAMLEAGQLEEQGERYILNTPIGRYFAQLDEASGVKPREMGSMATSRAAKPFTPLKGYKLPVDGAREGAGDHRKHKSRHF